MSQARLKGCPEWRVMLHGFVDGEFDPAHASQFKDHLATCPGCRTAMEQVRVERTVMNQDNVKWRPPQVLRAQVLSMHVFEQRQQSQKPGWRRALGLK
ncbi:anti-sigma factor family protein [Phyllobacterium chamaecytisi]|uniref:anti-sigma factor family protein n=1 Tax=Phyllobacterium chamaecytisi TaxID=2876082 RepID=UPI001CCC000A|nr:anti-sigma factor [Phyllobacterium sp. KW56]MBZ9605694.1 zf-HC2 domain-containing protein [Phyllobacterium sp. KW56]